MNLNTRFPNECLEDIFCFLSGTDLLQCTLVCSEWNSTIESSRSCMKKIKFRVYGFYMSDEKFENLETILATSNRKYECLMLGGEYSEKIQRLLSLGRTWKHIMSSLSFLTVEEFHEFLKGFQGSVEILTLQSVKIRERDKEDMIQRYALIVSLFNLFFQRTELII